MTSDQKNGRFCCNPTWKVLDLHLEADMIQFLWVIAIDLRASQSKSEELPGTAMDGACKRSSMYFKLLAL